MEGVGESVGESVGVDGLLAVVVISGGIPGLVSGWQVDVKRTPKTKSSRSLFMRSYFTKIPATMQV